MLPCTSVTSVETSVHALTQSSVHVASVHILTWYYVHMLLRASFLVLPRVYVYAHRLLREFMHMPLQAFMVAVAVNHVCLLFCLTHYCEVTLAMALWQLMYTSKVLLGIISIISWNLRNVAPCNGLVKKSAYISPVGQYFRKKCLFSIRSFINKYSTRMWFFCFVLDYLPLFSISIALMLSW